MPTSHLVATVSYSCVTKIKLAQENLNSFEDTICFEIYIVFGSNVARKKMCNPSHSKIALE